MAVFQSAVKEIHGRGPDEACDEHIDRMMIDLIRFADLLNEAVFHDDDAGGHRHRLDLIVGDVDGGGADIVMDADDFAAHLDAELGVKVGKRLIHQEDLRAADDGAAKRDALPLAAGKGARLAA